MPGSTKYSETELIALLKKGSEKAFDALYAMYAARLFAFCLQYVKAREDAEEIVQDTFVWLWNNRTSIRQNNTIKNLLFIRTKHYLINAYQARVNSPLFEDYTNYSNNLSEKTVNRIEFDEFVAKVEALLKTVSSTQAAVFRLSRFEQLRIKEISDRLSLSEQTVKNALSAVLKHLRTELSGENHS